MVVSDSSLEVANCQIALPTGSGVTSFVCQPQQTCLTDLVGCFVRTATWCAACYNTIVWQKVLAQKSATFCDSPATMRCIMHCTLQDAAAKRGSQ